MTIVNLFDFFPFAWIMHVLRMLIVFNVVQILLKNKYNTAITFFSLFIPDFIFSYLTVEVLVKTVTDEYLCVITFYVMQFIIISIVCKGKILAKLAAVVFGFFAYLSGTVIFGIINSFFVKNEIISGLQYEMPLVMYLASSVITYAGAYIILLILKLVKNKIDKKTNYDLKNIYLMIFPITHIFISIIALFSLQNYIKVNGKGYIPYTELIIAILYIICFASDFLIFFAIEHNEQTGRENEIYKKLALQNQIEYEQIMMLNKEKAEFKKIKHDMSNVISTAIGLIEIGKAEKSISILQDFAKDITELYGIRVCSNDTINTIISMKKESAQNKNCNLVVDINETFSMNIDDYDICRIMCNLLDNAINATANSKNSKDILLHMDISNDFISLILSNSFEENTVKVKNYGDKHGNGIKIVKNIINDYSGIYRCGIEAGIYKTEILIPNIVKNK